MDENDLAARVAEQEKQIGFLREELRRLKEGLAPAASRLGDLLRRRGFTVHKKQQDDDVVRPPGSARKTSEEYYQLLRKYSFRLLLRDIIKRQDGFSPEELVRYSTLDVVSGYAAFLLKAGILERIGRGRYRLARRPVRSFGPTLEWFVSEVFAREYVCEAMWGVKFRQAGSGGDYDLLAALEGKLLYAEVKSSPPKQIYVSEISAFLDRVDTLSPDFSLFIVDTELRMKDKVVEMFETALPGSAFGGAAVKRMKNELFETAGRILIINSKPSLVGNIGEALGWFLKRSANAS